MRNALVFVVTMMIFGSSAISVAADSAFPAPAKWNSPTIVRVFEQNAEALVSGIYRTGGFDNGASTLATNNDMLFRNPNSVQAMEATVTLLDASVVGTGFTTFPRAAVEGFFYWNGTGSGGSDQTGHVLASINLAIDTTTGQTVARRFLIRCNDPACNTNTPIDNVTIKPVNLFEPHRLKVSYDGSSFSYRIDDDPATVVAAPDTARVPPSNQFKALRTRVLTPASPGSSASVLALFENVAVNDAPYEDFSVKTLPRAQILPGSGTFSPRQTFDLVIMVETAGEPVSSVQFTVNGVDMSAFLPLAVSGTLPSGGATYRFPGVPANLVALGTPTVLGVQATTASGKTARGFAVWNAVAVTE
jgi:hypothetical protein